MSKAITASAINITSDADSAREVNTFLRLIVTKRARKLGLPWATCPGQLEKNIGNAVRAFWSTFPAARLVVDAGEAKIETGKHDHDATSNPLSTYFLSYANFLLPRAC